LNKQTKSKFFPTNNLTLTPQPMTAAPPQLATASLNFGVGRSHSIKKILVSSGGTPATQNFCQLLDHELERIGKKNRKISAN